MGRIFKIQKILKKNTIMRINYIDLQNILGIKFKNLNNLKKSLTHKSYNSLKNYEKLEFLGDRVLGLIISKRLLELYPNENEGSLDKKLASLVNKNVCYEIGKNLNLDKFILLGNQKKNVNLVQNKIISDCIEALIGAIYIDRGFETTEKFILKNWRIYLNLSVETKIDSKTRLQEYSLKKFKSLPLYKLFSNTGPKHNPIFKVGVKLIDSKFIFGTGKSKKIAEQNAASNLLRRIK